MLSFSTKLLRTRGPTRITPVIRRLSARLVLGVAVITATLALSIVALIAPAEASVVVPGSAWLGGQGVDVCYPWNGSCGTNQATTGGYGFQCVDLPQRLYKKMGWYAGTSFAGIRSAYQIYDKASSLGFVAHPNGGGYVPVPGDMVVESPTGSNSAGHVAVVDRVSGSTVYALEQNGNPTGWPSGAGVGHHNYTLAGSTVGNGYGAIRGIVHAPNDHLASSSGYEIAFQANTGSLLTVGAAGNVNWQQGMMPGTSPSVALLSNGGYEVAFQANTGDLITVGAAGANNWHLGMKQGTSPSITALPGGGYEMAFQANSGNLWSVGSDQHGNWGYGMMAGTSPSITGL